VAFQYLKGAHKKDGKRHFTSVCSDRTRDNGFKLKEVRFRLDMRKKFFMMWVVKHWNGMPRGVVDSPSLEVFKVSLDRSSGRCSCAWQWGLTRGSSKVPTKLNYSLIPRFCDLTTTFL